MPIEILAKDVPDLKSGQPIIVDIGYSTHPRLRFGWVAKVTPHRVKVTFEDDGRVKDAQLGIGQLRLLKYGQAYIWRILFLHTDTDRRAVVDSIAAEAKKVADRTQTLQVKRAMQELTRQMDSAAAKAANAERKWHTIIDDDLSMVKLVDRSGREVKIVYALRECTLSVFHPTKPGGLGLRLVGARLRDDSWGDVGDVYGVTAAECIDMLIQWVW